MARTPGCSTSPRRAAYRQAMSMMPWPILMHHRMAQHQLQPPHPPFDANSNMLLGPLDKTHNSMQQIRRSRTCLGEPSSTALVPTRGCIMHGVCHGTHSAQTQLCVPSIGVSIPCHHFTNMLEGQEVWASPSWSSYQHCIEGAQLTSRIMLSVASICTVTSVQCSCSSLSQPTNVHLGAIKCCNPWRG
jgi:hypothetical protein